MSYHWCFDELLQNPIVWPTVFCMTRFIIDDNNSSIRLGIVLIAKLFVCFLVDFHAWGVDVFGPTVFR